jgi:hypothetical protein
LWSCGHHSLPRTPSSHVLLMPNSKYLTHGISNLVSLITKTKLGLSDLYRPFHFTIHWRVEKCTTRFRIDSHVERAFSAMKFCQKTKSRNKTRGDWLNHIGWFVILSRMFLQVSKTKIFYTIFKNWIVTWKCYLHYLKLEQVVCCRYIPTILSNGQLYFMDGLHC